MDKSAQIQASQPVPDQPDQGLRNQEKPRSGYSRIRQRHHRLIAEHEALKADYQRLSEDCGELERAFSELKSLNETLVSDLRALRQQSPRSFPPFPSHLMGHHG